MVVGVSPDCLEEIYWPSWCLTEAAVSLHLELDLILFLISSILFVYLLLSDSSRVVC